MGLNIQSVLKRPGNGDISLKDHSVGKVLSTSSNKYSFIFLIRHLCKLSS